MHQNYLICVPRYLNTQPLLPSSSSHFLSLIHLGPWHIIPLEALSYIHDTDTRHNFTGITYAALPPHCVSSRMLCRQRKGESASHSPHLSFLCQHSSVLSIKLADVADSTDSQVLGHLANRITWIGRYQYHLSASRSLVVPAIIRFCDSRTR